MGPNNEKLLLNIRNAETDDLLDRVTAYRSGMDPEAIDLMELELQRRGVTPEQITKHADACRQECVFHPDGTAKKCTFCHKPAVREGMGWHRLFGMVPLFPRPMCYCKEHDKKKA